jgi:hypothetical protein
MLTLGKCLEKVLHAGVECARGAIKREVVVHRKIEHGRRKKYAEGTEKDNRDANFLLCDFREIFVTSVFFI